MHQDTGQKLSKTAKEMLFSVPVCIHMLFLVLDRALPCCALLCSAVPNAEEAVIQNGI